MTSFHEHGLNDPKTQSIIKKDIVSKDIGDFYMGTRERNKEGDDRTEDD